MKNTFGQAVTLTLFGESHGAAVGAVLDGMAAGVPVDESFLAACMDKRRARGDGLSTPDERGIKVEQTIEIEHRKLLGSSLYLKRMLMNILSNAVKYNKDYGKIYLSSREIPSDQDGVHMSGYGNWYEPGICGKKPV